MMVGIQRFTILPNAPANLNASNVTSTSVDLSWDAVQLNGGNVAEYNIYRDDSLIDTVSTNSYTDSTLTSATTYEYEVTAVSSVGAESDRSNLVSVTTS